MNSTEIAELLIQSGADVNGKDRVSCALIAVSDFIQHRLNHVCNMFAFELHYLKEISPCILASCDTIARGCLE